MRTITKTFNLFEYSELSDEAKEKAIQEYHDNGFEYAWMEEWRESLKGFSTRFGIETDFSISPHSYSHASMESSNWELDELEGIELWDRLEDMGVFEESFISGTCPFTGYTGDEDLLDPIRKFKESKDGNMTFRDLMQDCLDSWKKAAISDMENQESEEYFAELCEINNWMFEEDGTMNNLYREESQ